VVAGIDPRDEVFVARKHHDQDQIADQRDVNQAERAENDIGFTGGRRVEDELPQLFKILQEACREFILHAPSASEADIILGALSLIDVSLVGNLILIVVFSGYENFVSRIDPGDHPDWPEWMTKVDFAGSSRRCCLDRRDFGHSVLKAFMNIDVAFDAQKMGWLVGVHLVFVVSALMLALSDRWAAITEAARLDI